MIHKARAGKEAPLQLRARRPEGLALAFVLWSSAIWVVATSGPLDRFGTLKGTDFSQFYVSARLVATGRAAALYDWSAYTHELATQVPGPEGLLYLPVYPPTLALLLAPLGALPYLPALVVWTVISAGVYLAAGAWLIARGPGLRRDVTSAALLLVAFPAFPQLLLYGQVSVLALALVVLAWWAWTHGRQALAGIALGALVFKPQMLVIPACAVLVAPSLPLAVGVVTGIAIELGLVTAALGTGTLAGYLHTVRRVLAHPASFEPKPEQIQSLRGFFLAFGGETIVTTVLFLAAAIAILLLARQVIRRTSSPGLAFSAIVLAGLLVNPHLYVYDLVLLLVPLALVTEWLLSTPVTDPAVRQTGWAVLVLYWLPLVAAGLGLLHVQLMAPAMVWLLWSLRAAARTPSTADR